MFYVEDVGLAMHLLCIVLMTHDDGFSLTFPR